MDKIKNYFADSYHELVSKTTWPSWAELQKTSTLVAVASIIIALVIFGMDKVISAVLETFYKLF